MTAGDPAGAENGAELSVMIGPPGLNVLVAPDPYWEGMAGREEDCCGEEKELVLDTGEE